MRLLPSLMSCCHTTVGGYSGTSLSLSSRKRWLRGSFSASRRSSRSAMLTRGLPHHVCASQSVDVGTGQRMLQPRLLRGAGGWLCSAASQTDGATSIYEVLGALQHWMQTS